MRKLAYIIQMMTIGFYSRKNSSSSNQTIEDEYGSSNCWIFILTQLVVACLDNQPPAFVIFYLDDGGVIVTPEIVEISTKNSGRGTPNERTTILIYIALCEFIADRKREWTNSKLII